MNAAIRNSQVQYAQTQQLAEAAAAQFRSNSRFFALLDEEAGVAAELGCGGFCQVQYAQTQQLAEAAAAQFRSNSRFFVQQGENNSWAIVGSDDNRLYG